MIIVQLAGGLGNQMFQYAAGRSLSIKHKTDLMLDLSFLLDRRPRKDFVFRDYNIGIFKIDPKIASKNEELNFGFKARKIKRMFYCLKQRMNRSLPMYVSESHYLFDSKFFSIPSHAYLEGYWQSEDYFKEIEVTIRKDFTFSDPLDEKGLELAKNISSSNSICLFVRRGDYASIKSTIIHLELCGIEYYSKAFKYISEKTDNLEVYVFSDDLEWCKANIKFDRPTIYVDNSFAGNKYGQHLHLMKLCRHFIISNSSFGWWGAWLNPDPNKIVIAPKQWYKNPQMDTSHLIPNNWIRI
jgi:hypothetical protein